MGAESVPGGGVHFRVWAPEQTSVEVLIRGANEADAPSYKAFEKEGETGYFSGLVEGVGPGTLYKYRLGGGEAFPDLASRFQPDGPHHFSEVIDPGAYHWGDAGWPGVKLEGAVIYELHVGTFTAEGTWQSAIPHLPELAELGVRVLEVMPVNEFPGRFGWGYDGVHPFAPTRLYGRPDDFRAFVDAAHAAGLGVILDVVYNHIGPDGNYFRSFSPYYFTHRHETDWGEAINFYGEHCEPVREFFAANAAYWVREFHLDGLRLDATQNIYDESKEHILTVIAREARHAAGERSAIVVGENEPQDVRLIRSPDQGGYGLDALWNDDFHHCAMVRLTGHNEAYYSDYLGKAQEFVSAAKYGFLYQGQWYRWQHQRRGTATFASPRPALINFLQNHDQVSNSARGLRAHALAAPGLHKAAVALMLLNPGTPMLFQGEEFAASTPFLYFADHKAELSAMVKAGRHKFMAQFRSIDRDQLWEMTGLPHAEETFRRCKLDHAERQRNASVVALYRDLLRLRREDPTFQLQGSLGIDGAVLSLDAFVLRHFGSYGDDRLVIVNFGIDLHYDPAPEPLLAPPEDHEWKIILSTEAVEYGGAGVAPADTVENWRIPGYSAIVLKPEPGRDPLAAPRRRRKSGND